MTTDRSKSARLKASVVVRLHLVAAAFSLTTNPAAVANDAATFTVLVQNISTDKTLKLPHGARPAGGERGAGSVGDDVVRRRSRGIARAIDLLCCRRVARCAYRHWTIGIQPARKNPLRRAEVRRAQHFPPGFARISMHSDPTSRHNKEKGATKVVAPIVTEVVRQAAWIVDRRMLDAQYFHTRSNGGRASGLYARALRRARGVPRVQHLFPRVV